ncbi:MAG: PIN domain-containing protein [Candidatus Riflebacteria bacterium]|nr:PIN domain-containing protein [Candidatus Riflebacteria bacterium]
MSKEKILFDTSALLPAFLPDHPMHSRCYNWLNRACSNEFEWAVPKHCLAEVYAGLTAIPSSPRIDANSALKSINDNILGQAKIISLNESDYLKAIEKCVTSGALSGAIYDALVVAAEKFNAHRIITSNYKDFARLVGKNSGLICLP